MKNQLKQDLSIPREASIIVSVQNVSSIIPAFRITVDAGSTQYRFLYVRPLEGANNAGREQGTVQDFSREETGAEEPKKQPVKIQDPDALAQKRAQTLAKNRAAENEDHRNEEPQLNALEQQIDSKENTPFKFDLDLKGVTIEELASLGITFNNDTISFDNRPVIENLQAQGKLYPRSFTNESIRFNDAT